MPQAQTTDQPKRWPLIILPENRQEDTSKDSRLVNGYIEKELGGDFWLYKRPGLATSTQPSAAAGTGGGVYNWKGDIYSIVNWHLYKGTTDKGAVDSTNGVYRFDSCMGAVPKLVLGNGVKGYCYDDANGLVQMVVAVTLTAGSFVVGVQYTVVTVGTTDFVSIGAAQNAVGVVFTATGVGAGTGTAIGPAVITAGAFVVGTEYKILTAGTTDFTLVGALDSNVGTVFTATGVGVGTGTVTGSNFPTAFVKGWAYLDATTYVMDSKANLYGSGLNAPMSWDALNKLVVQIEPSAGVALSKQLVYVIALKQESTEVFYDAGNATGSPLGRVQGAKVNWGCISADSVREADGALFWLATNRSGAVRVMKMDNLKAEIISSPAIERLLGEADFTAVYAFALNYEGHRWYFVTLKNSNLTLAFDNTTGLWAQWTDSNGNYFPFVDSTFKTSTAQTLLQHETDGYIYTVDSANTSDNGSVITVDIYTPNFDAGTSRDKTLPMLYFDAAQTPGSVLQARYSDDDYQSWSSFRKVDLSQKKPQLDNNGTFKRRAYNFRHQSNTRFRIKAVDFQMDVGTL